MSTNIELDVLSDDFGTHRKYSSFSASTIDHSLPRNKFFQLLCKHLIIIHPFGPFRYFCDFCIIIILMYTCIEIPITVAFELDLNLSSPWGIVAICIDLFLFLDVLINFRTAYFDKMDRLRIINNDYEIAKKYITSWFLLDLLASIPFQLFVDNNSNASSRFWFHLFRSVKILRTIKMIRIFNRFTKQIVNRDVKASVKLFKLVLSMLLFAHFSACLWYFVGANTEDSWIDSKGLRGEGIDISNFKKYSMSWYWAVVTLFTTGYGDITATNVIEQWICSIIILIGTMFFAYFIGTLTVLITEGDKVKSFKFEKLEEAQHFCDIKRLPKEMTRAILTNIRYHCNYNYCFDETDLISTLPFHLQQDIYHWLSKNILKQIDVFKSLNDNVLGSLSLKLKSISCNSGHVLYHKDSRAKEIYIQRTGKSLLDFHDTNVKKQILRRGNVFGISSLISPKRKTTVKCKTWSEFYVLQVADIVSILQTEYPKTWTKRWKKIANVARNTDLNIDRKINFHPDDYDKMNYETQSMLAFFLKSNASGHTSTVRSIYRELDKKKKKQKKNKKKIKHRKRKKKVTKFNMKNIKNVFHHDKNDIENDKDDDNGGNDGNNSIKTTTLTGGNPPDPQTLDYEQMASHSNFTLKKAMSLNLFRGKKLKRDSVLRDLALFAHNRDRIDDEKQKKVNLTTLNKPGIDDFYAHNIEDSKEEKLTDTDDEPGDIAPGLEFIDDLDNDNEQEPVPYDMTARNTDQFLVSPIRIVSNSAGDYGFAYNSKPSPKGVSLKGRIASSSAATVKAPGKASGGGARKGGGFKGRVKTKSRAKKPSTKTKRKAPKIVHKPTYSDGSAHMTPVSVLSSAHMHFPNLNHFDDNEKVIKMMNPKLNMPQSSRDSHASHGSLPSSDIDQLMIEQLQDSELSIFKEPLHNRQDADLLIKGDTLQSQNFDIVFEENDDNNIDDNHTNKKNNENINKKNLTQKKSNRNIFGDILSGSDIDTDNDKEEQQ